MIELVKSGDECIGPTIDSAGAVGTKVEEIDPANLRPRTFGIDLRESLQGDQSARVVMIVGFREPHQRFEFRLASSRLPPLTIGPVGPLRPSHPVSWEKPKNGMNRFIPSCWSDDSVIAMTTHLENLGV